MIRFSCHKADNYSYVNFYGNESFGHGFDISYNIRFTFDLKDKFVSMTDRSLTMQANFRKMYYA